jgi:hypothetical protein
MKGVDRVRLLQYFNGIAIVIFGKVRSDNEGRRA